MRINFLKGFVTKDISVINTTDRLFEGIATVEMVDKQGEITVRDSLLKQFPILMKRGGPVMDTHSNRHVGKILNYSPIDVIDPKTKKKYYGIKILAQIFKDNKLDDEVWNFITNGTYKGLSFGGANRSERIPVQQKDGGFAYKLDDLELYEMSVCEEPAVSLAVITDFNKLAKSMSIDQLAKMDIVERDDDQIIVKCNTVRCYVLSGNPEAHLENKFNEVELNSERFNQNIEKAVGREQVEMLNTGKQDNLDNNMETKDEKSKEGHKDSEMDDDYKDEDEKSSKKESKEEVIEEETEDKKEKSSVDILADLVGKYIEHSTKAEKKVVKRFAELEAKLDKALEDPAPAEEHKPNEQVKLNNEYNDGGKEGQGSEDGKDADAESEDDKVQLEEKNEQVIAQTKKSKDEEWTSTVRGGQQAGSQETKGNAILKAAREAGPEGLGEIANMINKGGFGKIGTTAYGSGYPEV